MTANEKKIRFEWEKFKRKRKKETKIFLETENISKVFSQMFR